jgi:hypothetical protein
MKTSLSSFLGVAVGLVALPSLAAPSATDRSLAQSLFDQGKTQMDAGNYALACPKLQESQRLDPGGGTLMNLALCHEQQGKIASAWTEFKEALGIARRDERQDRVSAAEDHIAALEPKLPYLTLVVPSATEDEELKLDGAVIGRAAWGSPLSVDPGVHELSASAPGHKPWSNSFTVSLSQKHSVSVPDLELDPNAASAAGPSTSSTPAVDGAAPPGTAVRTSSGSSAAGWVVGGLGVVGLGVGGFFGMQALKKRKDSDALCPTDDTCTGSGAKYNQQAYTAAWISDAGFGVGILGLGIGTYLLLSSSGSSESASSQTRRHGAPLHADVRSLPGGGAMSVSGSF